MQKIPTLFVRDFTHKPPTVTGEVTPGAEWVLAGEGIATRKLDGTCCLIEGGQLFKRYDAKHGKTPPPAFRPAQPDPDPTTGHWPGWVPVEPVDRWHLEAGAGYLDDDGHTVLRDGTYELVGPRVQGNPEGLTTHLLVRHGSLTLPDADLYPRTLEGIRAYLLNRDDIEGVVWHHPDGRMVKLKGTDLGIKRRPTPAP